LVDDFARKYAASLNGEPVAKLPSSIFAALASDSGVRGFDILISADARNCALGS